MASNNMQDDGLDRLMALHHLLREFGEPLQQVLVRTFRDAHYVKENSRQDNCDKDNRIKVKPEMKLCDFLHQVNSEIKRLNRSTDGKKNKGRGSNIQQISNIAENDGPLFQVSVGDLIQRDETCCKVLLDLDLNFIINILVNKVIDFDLDKDMFIAIEEIKKIRSPLSHARFNFTQKEFEDKLDDLLKYLGVMYHYLGRSTEDLALKKEIFLKEAKSKQTPKIFNQLRQEVHKKYNQLDHHIIPTINHDKPSSEPVVVEDLVKFVEEQRFQRGPPILVCGHYDADMSYLLGYLATSLVRGNTRAFPLVLLLEDPEDSTRHQSNLTEEKELWDRVYKCLDTMAPTTMASYDPEEVKAVLHVYKAETLFLVGWSVRLSGGVRSEMKSGTWVLAHRGKPDLVLEWTVLRMQEYTETQVEQMLEKDVATNIKEVIQIYQDCQYKSDIASLELIKAFAKMTRKSSCNTFWEFAKVFNLEKLKTLDHDDDKPIINNPILRLGKLAFQAACKNKYTYSEQELELEKIPSEVQERFLERGLKGAMFTHSIARDFLIAKFVASDPMSACKNWLGKPDQFRRIFCFTCFIWSEDCKRVKCNQDHIKQFLHCFLGTPVDEPGKHRQEQMEVDGKKNNSQDPVKEDSKKKKKERNCKQEAMEVGKTKKKRKHDKQEPMKVDESHETDSGVKHGEESGGKKKSRRPRGCTKLVKYSFSNWKFLLDVDDACCGQKRVRELLADILARFPTWVFPADLALRDDQLKKVEGILKLVRLRSRVTIKLECGSDVGSLIRVWEKLRNIDKLQNYANVMMGVAHDQMTPPVDSKKMVELPQSIAAGGSRVYVTHFIGPLLCPDTLYLLKCKCMSQLKELDVSVYDLNSLSEVLACEGLKSLQYVTVRVNLEVSQQTLCSSCTINIPEGVELYLAIRYFKNIRKLLECFEHKDRLTSLSIRDVIVSQAFSLDLSMFKSLKGLSLRFQRDLNRSPDQVMEVDAIVSPEPTLVTLHRHDWMLQLIKMKLPHGLERLLLRNMDFCCDRNQHLLELLHLPSLGRLMVLDCMLTICGARKVVSHKDQGDLEDLEDLENRTKKLRVNWEKEVQKLVDKKPRLSKQERLALQQNKPPGKELVLISEVSLCTCCHKFPCTCPAKWGEDMRDTLDELSGLIVDIYTYDILTFSYTSNVCSLRKDVCGDLSVNCVVSDLSDDKTAELGSSDNTSLYTLFLRLTLAQSITFRGTRLSPEGVMAVIRHLRDVKEKHGPGRLGGAGDLKEVEPFNLTVETSWYTSTHLHTCLQPLADLVLSLPCLAVFNFKCEDESRCVKMKKTFNGILQLNGKQIN